MAKSLNLENKKTQRVTAVTELPDYGSLAPDEALMLKEEMGLAVRGTPVEAVWASAQELSGTSNSRLNYRRFYGDRRFRQSLRLAKRGIVANRSGQTSGFGIADVTAAVLGFSRSL